MTATPTLAHQPKHRRDYAAQTTAWKPGDIAVITYPMPQHVADAGHVRSSLAEYTELGQWWCISHGGVVNPSDIVTATPLDAAITIRLRTTLNNDAHVEQVKQLLEEYFGELLAETKVSRRA